MMTKVLSTVLIESMKADYANGGLESFDVMPLIESHELLKRQLATVESERDSRSPVTDDVKAAAAIAAEREACAKIVDSFHHYGDDTRDIAAAIRERTKGERS